MKTERKLILLVEDNPDDEELILMALKRSQMLNEIVIVHDGEEALNFLFGAGVVSDHSKQPLPQVMLLDLKLPKLGGLDVLKRVRADQRMQLLPVVILTSSNEEEDIITSYKLGANSYVRKPISFDNFAESVQQLCLYWLLINQSPPL